MAYQAAKGMHFLHSSGLVHHNLKSLNLLLYSKWNCKAALCDGMQMKRSSCEGGGQQVSNFGLTKVKEDIKHTNEKEGQGSVHWTALEILNKVLEVDDVKTDVYAFGIILWEQPYMGMR